MHCSAVLAAAAASGDAALKAGTLPALALLAAAAALRRMRNHPLGT
jgi:hypothetical protein